MPAASPAEALIRVRRLSFDVLEIASAFREGVYGKDDDAEASALCELEDRNPGFSDEECRAAFAVGKIWVELS